MKVRISFVFEGQSSVRDVVEVLEPLEVGDGHTASVDVQIRDDKDGLGKKNFVGCWGSRTVGTLCNDLHKEKMSYD